MKKATILAFLALGLIAGASTSTSVVKVSHLSDTEVGISCKNGGDPTGKMIGNTLIISCGK